jgi:hypothetical protein
MDAEELFTRWFLPLYPPDARADLARARASDANPGRNPAIEAHLGEAGARFVENAPALFGVDLGLDGSDASVHRLSAALTRERRDAWAASGAPGSPENLLFNGVVHGSAYVGSCIVARHGGQWRVRRPLWESLVHLRSRAGEADLAVFHWWLKSLADGEQGTTLADRYRAHVEVPCAKPEELPVLVAPPRMPPRLKNPRYATLHRWLRAHLPELADLGADFPSQERFEAYAFRWVEAHLLGGGRMVLLAGASPSGLHLFWMGASGFEKGVHVVADVFPDPVVRLEDDRVVALTSHSGETRTNEWLWWGP